MYITLPCKQNAEVIRPLECLEEKVADVNMLNLSWETVLLLLWQQHCVGLADSISDAN